jgi:DNA-binding MarR family transcriptional regulator
MRRRAILTRMGGIAAAPADSGQTERDEAVRAAWHALIAAKVASWNTLERELGDAHGLGVSDFEVLDQLVHADDQGRRAQNIADAVHLSQSALSRLADRLERHGLVRRCSCVTDRRGVFLELTDAGRAKHAAALRTYCDVLSRTLPPALIARYA